VRTRIEAVPFQDVLDRRGQDGLDGQFLELAEDATVAPAGLLRPPEVSGESSAGSCRGKRCWQFIERALQVLGEPGQPMPLLRRDGDIPRCVSARREKMARSFIAA